MVKYPRRFDGNLRQEEPAAMVSSPLPLLLLAHCLPVVEHVLMDVEGPARCRVVIESLELPVSSAYPAQWSTSHSFSLTG